MSALGDELGLAGKVAVITGAASGIGQRLCEVYARAGVRTVAGYYAEDPHDPAVTLSLVEGEGGECAVVEADVRSSDAVEALCQTAIDSFGRLDIAVASAGSVRMAGFEEMTDQQWKQLIEIDLSGVMRLFRSAAGRMTGSGAMVALSSVAGGHYGWQEHAHYAAAKAGVLGLCRSLAIELAPRSIRVNAVLPGVIDTPQSADPVSGLGPEGLVAVGKQIPWGRFGRAQEVARAIRFLTSDDSSYITGSLLVVDGGMTVKMPL